MRKGLYQKFVSGCRGGCQPPARYESKYLKKVWRIRIHCDFAKPFCKYPDLSGRMVSAPTARPLFQQNRQNPRF